MSDEKDPNNEIIAPQETDASEETAAPKQEETSSETIAPKQSEAKRDSVSKKQVQEKDYMQIAKDKFIEYRGEFRKIIWLSQKELIKRTITVIVTSVLFAFVIFGMDSVLSIIVQNFFLLIGK